MAQYECAEDQYFTIEIVRQRECRSGGDCGFKIEVTPPTPTTQGSQQAESDESGTHSVCEEIQPLNKYKVCDGSDLKIRTVMTRCERVAKTDKIIMKFQTHIIVCASPKVGGERETHMAYCISSQNPNKYTLDDGTRIEILVGIKYIDTKPHGAEGQLPYYVTLQIAETLSS